MSRGSVTNIHISMAYYREGDGRGKDGGGEDREENKNVNILSRRLTFDKRSVASPRDLRPKLTPMQAAKSAHGTCSNNSCVWVSMVDTRCWNIDQEEILYRLLYLLWQEKILFPELAGTLIFDHTFYHYLTYPR